MKNGDVFRAYGYEWEILDLDYHALYGKSGILCLMKKPVKHMLFSEKDNNDYSESCLTYSHD